MKPKTTIILLSLLALAAAVVGVSRLISLYPKKKQPPASRRVFAETPAEARKLAITTFDGTKLVFTNSDGVWRMVQPHRRPARRDTLENIVRALGKMHYVRAFDPADKTEGLGDSLSGLAKPRWGVTLTDANDKTFTLLVGCSAPKIGSNIEETYVRPAGESRSFVVAADLAGLLDRDVDDYRDKTVFKALDPRRVVAIEIRGRRNCTLKKQGPDWGVTTPVQAEADRGAVEDLLRKLTNLQAERYLLEGSDTTPAKQDLKKFGLDKPQLILRVTDRQAGTAKEKTRTLLLGNRRGESVCAKLRGRDEIFTLPATTLDDLQPGPDKLRTKTILVFSGPQVARIEFSRGREKFILQRNGDWKMTSPFTGPADADAADALLRKLAALRAETWIAAPPGERIDIASPTAGITLTLRGGDEKMLKISLLVGADDPSGKNVYCKMAGASAVAAVKSADLEPILKPAKYYWSKGLVELPAGGQITGLSIDRPSGEKWAPALPVTADADGEKVRRILEQLQDLRAERIVALGQDIPKPYSSAKQRLVVSFTVTEPTSEDETPATKPSGKRPATITKNYRLIVVKVGKDCFAWLERPGVKAVGKFRPELFTLLSSTLQSTPPPR